MRASGATSAMTVGAMKNPPSAVFNGLAAAEQAGPPRGLAESDVLEDLLVCGLVDDWAGVEILCGIALFNLCDPVAQAVAEDVVEGRIDDGAGAGGALLAVESEGGEGHALDGCVDVAVGLDDDGVFAAHLEDGALDELLARLGFGGALVDFEADSLGAGEGDEARLRMRHDGRAETGSFAGAEVDDAVGQASPLPAALKKMAAVVGASPGRLQSTQAVLPQAMAAAVMPAIMASGKFHGGITAPTPRGM